MITHILNVKFSRPCLLFLVMLVTKASGAEHGSVSPSFCSRPLVQTDLSAGRFAVLGGNGQLSKNLNYYRMCDQAATLHESHVVQQQCNKVALNWPEGVTIRRIKMNYELKQHYLQKQTTLECESIQLHVTCE